jgi:hypothetical protein
MPHILCSECLTSGWEKGCDQGYRSYAISEPDWHQLVEVLLQPCVPRRLLCLQFHFPGSTLDRLNMYAMAICQEEWMGVQACRLLLGICLPVLVSTQDAVSEDALPTGGGGSRGGNLHCPPQMNRLDYLPVLAQNFEVDEQKRAKKEEKSPTQCNRRSIDPPYTSYT